ncbi:MAG: flavodoxin domain-containing protein, partial [bacterium]
VSTGDTLDLGGAKLTFVEARMLHWPDSMFAYLEGDAVLFTNDAFGMHLACSERFTDQIEPTVWRYESSKYYANILLHFSPLVKRLLDKLPSLNLDIKLLAPDHGTIWREQPERIIELYREWAEQRPTRKAVVIYDTMWHSTARMAQAIGEGLSAGGATVRLLPLAGTHRSDVLTELLDAGALVVGSPTMNNQIYPTVADAMTYIRGLKPKNLVGASFGSYGWSGEAPRQLDQQLVEMKVELAAEGLRFNYVPDTEALAACREHGQKVAKALLAKIDSFGV